MQVPLPFVHMEAPIYLKGKQLLDYGHEETDMQNSARHLSFIFCLWCL